MKKIKWVAGVFSGLAAAVLAFTLTVSSAIPDQFSVVEGQGFAINSGLPISTVSIDDQGRKAGDSYQVDVKLMGVLPVKQVNVDVVEQTMVVPCGTPFGIKMFTQGVVVVGMSSVDAEGGSINPAKEAGIQEGDVLISIDGKKLNSNQDVSDIIEHCEGKTLDVELQRKNMTFHVDLTPVKSASEDCYKLGAWVRDSSAGIGTLTFYEPNTKVFGGLGHAICDVDTGEILPLSSGEIVSAVIGGVQPGKVGAPGELRGTFKSVSDMGILATNGETGVYGVLDSLPCQHEPVPVAMRQQVQSGPAQIMTTIEGEEPKTYDIEIEKINFDEDSPTRNMIVHITDPELLEKTGGIVQGMSGSPILQNGQLVGAVTHVFVNDPTRGYGIFAENMLETASGVQCDMENEAA